MDLFIDKVLIFSQNMGMTNRFSAFFTPLFIRIVLRLHGYTARGT